MQAQTRARIGEEEFAATTSGEVIGWRPQPETELWKGTETILFVEDETFVRRVTAEVLCAAGYGVLTAQSAEEALRLYDRHSGAVDLLLTDLVLPGQTGSALAAILNRLDRRLKILFVTGYVERLKTMEGQDCLPKPFSTSGLLEKVRQVLDRRGLAAAV
jgi:two-component system, cell cycle sensor histidine kinase and response regulator CckA